VVEIPVASDTLDIGARLQHEGLIRNAFAFQVGIRRWGLAGKLKAVRFRLYDMERLAAVAVSQVKVQTAKCKMQDAERRRTKLEGRS